MNRSLIRRFPSTYLITIFLIACMVSARDDSLEIFWIFYLNLGHTSLEILGETFAVSLDISKASDRVWHKSLISKLPSYGFYPSLCPFILSFLSDRSITTVVDGLCSSSEPANKGVSKGSVLSPTLFLLFINDLLNLTQCPIHSYADDSAMH